LDGIAELRALRQRLPDIAGAVLASTDGMLIASDVGTGKDGRPGSLEAETVAALAAAGLGLGQRFAATVRPPVGEHALPGRRTSGLAAVTSGSAAVRGLRRLDRGAARLQPRDRHPEG
jgi:hypothetical protein